MRKHEQIWTILGAYGVFFALLSGVEEVINGKYWKLLLSFVLAFIIFWSLTKNQQKK